MRNVATGIIRRLGRLGRRAAGGIGLAPVAARDLCLRTPGLSAWAVRRWSLRLLSEGEAAGLGAARRRQFGAWHPEDLAPRLAHSGRNGWRTLVPEPDYPPPAPAGTLCVATRAFFQATPAEAGGAALASALGALEPGRSLLVYAPHRFAHTPTDFAWVPRWQDLIALAGRVPGTRVVDFNPGFDRNGFFHVLIDRRAEEAAGTRRTGAGRYFYLNVGRSRLLGHSAKVLSATGLCALERAATPVQEHSFQARVPEDVPISPGMIAMGHYGPWITGARQAGALTILYGPGDRFRPTREDAPFFLGLQTRGTFEAQYQASHAVIMQAGGRWRTADAWPHPGLCRWMDLPVSPAVFPRTKKRIAPAGRRVFCFIGLYDDYQKGHDIAVALCRLCPDFRFLALGCKPIGESNCEEFPSVDNRSARFRRLAARADFLVSPARDDAQPGTVAECGSLGLLPIISETTGYVLSFPERLYLDDLGQCEAVLRRAQAAQVEEVEAWQALNARYVEEYHRPQAVNGLLDLYLQQAREEYRVA